MRSAERPSLVVVGATKKEKKRFRDWQEKLSPGIRMVQERVGCPWDHLVGSLKGPQAAVRRSWVENELAWKRAACNGIRGEC